MMMRGVAAVALAFCASAARAETPPPLDAYGKLPAIETIQISPDGKRFAFIVTNGDARFAAVSEVDGGKILVRVPAGTRKITSVQWAGSDHIILTFESDSYVAGLMGGRQSWTVASDVDLVQRRMHPLIDIPSESDEVSNRQNGEIMNVVYGRPQIRTLNGRTLVYFEGIHFEDGQGSLSLFKYDPRIARSSMVRAGNSHSRGWLVAENGEPLAEEAYNDGARTWTLHTKGAGDFGPKVNVPASIEQPSMMGLGRDRKSILVAAPNPVDKPGPDTSLVEVGPSQTAFGAPILDHDFDDLVFDPTTEALIGAEARHGESWSYTFFDPKDQARWNGLDKAYPNDVVQLESMSGDHKRWVISVDSPTEGPAYALVDFNTGKAEWIGYNYEAASKALADKRTFTFKAADGLELEAYLTTPKGRELKNLPLIIFPHGGPAVRDEPGFDWWAQAMASRGYAVLQVEYRGSNGYGWKHLSAGFGQWGRKMQTDLSDGVRYLAGKGMIDPKRVCIVGGSYGGYAALAGATIDRGVYRCAVSVAGVSDLRRMVKWDARDGDSLSSRYWLRFMGVEKVADPRLDEISPLRHVEKVDIPVLLIHGKDDTVVDFSQSQIMYDALKRQGKDAQLVVLPHEDHWLLTGATRLQMLQATMDFLQKNNPPG